jgi:hypothetical protein
VLRFEESAVAEIIAFPLEPVSDALGLPATLTTTSKEETP